MSYKGMVGYMGPTSIPNPIVNRLINEWNTLGLLDGYIYSDDDRPMPEHLRKLSDAINCISEHLNKNIK